MKNNRRDWLKKAGLLAVAFGASRLETFATINQNTEPIVINDKRINLRSNENPYGPSSLARNAMINSVVNSNRYGWFITSDLIAAIAKKNNVTQKNIILGAGSTQILELALQFSALKTGNFVISENTYNYWTSPHKKLGLKKVNVPLTKDKKLNLKALLKAINANTRMVYVCNPNNPTGTILDRNELVSFIKKATKKTLVLIDEAYIEYTTQKSVSHLALEYPNLLIVRTFSKMYGLAGARVGYGIANEKTIQKISSLQSWPNGSISVVSANGALASLENDNFKESVFEKNERVKDYTIREFKKLGIVTLPSFTNFIYFSLEKYPKNFFNRLKENNIIGTKIYEEKGKWSRITIGTKEEMKKLIEALK